MNQNKRSYILKIQPAECPKCHKTYKRLLSHQKKDPNCDQEKPKIKFDHKKYGTQYFTQKMREYNARKLHIKHRQLLDYLASQFNYQLVSIDPLSQLIRQNDTTE